jgi:hypothetical protein
MGFATCGKGGERLASKLGMRISETTLLWSLHLAPIPAVGKGRVVGIDDWSWRRGQRYGSILVNLETHKIIDLLPERTVESVIAWLEAHPEVEVVSRDRGGTYVDVQMEGESCRFRNKYLPLFGSYREKSSPLDYLTGSNACRNS